MTPNSDTAVGSVVADIGGTNARFAYLDSAGHPGEARVLPTADFAGLRTALEAYMEMVTGAPIRRLVIAIAGPIAGDTVALTNGTWQFSRQELQRQLGLQRLEILNDFEALALSLPHLAADDLMPLGGSNLAKPRNDSPKAVTGPGTGLGMCGLIKTRSGWHPVPTEGGHTSLAPVTDRELAAWQFLRQRHGRVSAERVLSGPGLTELHQALESISGHSNLEKSPEEIVQLALTERDPLAREALSMFCAWLGDKAGDLALMFNAYGGIYLAGGILPTIAEFLRDSDFRDRFDTKGRGNAVVSLVPTYLISTKTPALVGCASLLR